MSKFYQLFSLEVCHLRFESHLSQGLSLDLLPGRHRRLLKSEIESVKITFHSELAIWKTEESESESTTIHSAQLSAAHRIDKQ